MNSVIGQIASRVITVSSRRSICLDLCYPAVPICRARYVHSYLVRADLGKRELAPYLVVAGHTSIWHGLPGSPIPILHLEISYPVQAERLSFGRLLWIGEIILKRKDINLVDVLTGVEIDLNPIRVGV